MSTKLLTYDGPTIPKTKEVEPMLKQAIGALGRTWTSPDAARLWLKRNPQEGLVVSFDGNAAVYRLAPAAEEPDFASEPVFAKAPKAKKPSKAHVKAVVAQAIDEAIAEIEAQPPVEPTVENTAPASEVVAPEIVQEPDMPRKSKSQPVFENDAALAVQNVTLADSLLVIGGLPDNSVARVWACEFARKLGRPIHVVDRFGKHLQTIDKEALDAMKAADKAKAGARKVAKASEPKEPKTAPDGKRLQVVQMCMRSEGASTKELIDLTGWKGCPWKWTIGNNKNGTGLADKFGYRFHTDKVADEVRYFLRQAA